MKCPHCLVTFHDEWNTTWSLPDRNEAVIFRSQKCPSCERLIVLQARGPGEFIQTGRGPIIRLKNPASAQERLVVPRGSARPPTPPGIPEGIREDYEEACLILVDSPKASAALARRCLQRIIREKVGIKRRTLYDEIQELLKTHELPSHIRDDLHELREIGNAAAHPIQAENTGEILPVDPHEAEWSLEIVESLFDYYYVQPAAAAERRLKRQEKWKLGTASISSSDPNEEDLM